MIVEFSVVPVGGGEELAGPVAASWTSSTRAACPTG